MRLLGFLLSHTALSGIIIPNTEEIHIDSDGVETIVDYNFSTFFRHHDHLFEAFKSSKP